MKKIIPVAFALTLAAHGAHAAKKEDPKAKAALKAVNAAASLLVEMTKEDEGAAKKKSAKPAKKPAANAPADKNSPKGSAATKAAAEQKAAAKKADESAAGVEDEATVEATRQKAMDEQMVLERSLAAVEEAQALYGARCIACHGAKGRGDGPAASALNPRPRDYTNKAWLKLFADDALGKAIVEGGAAIGESPLMPPNPDLKDKPEVVKALVSMIRGF